MLLCFFFFFFNDTATTEIYTLSLHDALPISYGAAYADLNNDGRLDLVVNNIDAPAFIYEGVQPKDDAHHYLQITLAGESPNRGGIGSKLILAAGGRSNTSTIPPTGATCPPWTAGSISAWVAPRASIAWK